MGYSYLLITLFIYSMYLMDVYNFNNRQRELAFWFSVLLLFLFSALRGSGDFDYFTYKSYSLSIQTLNDLFIGHNYLEFGFKLISYLNNRLNFGPQVVIGLMNLISLTSISFFVNKYSKNKILSLVIFLPFFFQLDMHSARTAVAVSIGLLSFHSLYEKDYLNYFIFVFLSYLFHRSAVVLIIPFILDKPNIFKRFFSTNVFTYIFLLWVIKHFVSFIPLIKYTTFFIPNDIASKILAYPDSRFGYPFSLFDPRLLLALLLSIILISIFKKVKSKEDRKYDLIRMLMIYSVVNSYLYIILSEVTIFTVRFTHYFNIYSVISIPLIFHNYQLFIPNRINKTSKLTLIFKVVFLLIYLGYIIIVMPKVPYKFFFS